jgi:hypothetical protein
MSRGLGRVERTILDALQATSRPYVELWELSCLVDGRIAGLDEQARHWDRPICQPHPRIWRSVPHVWSGYIDHVPACYPPEGEPAASLQESVRRAVRSLARKGLVRTAYEGRRPKCLVVYLPTTDASQLPKAQRLERMIEAHVSFGMRMGRRRDYAL